MEKKTIDTLRVMLCGEIEDIAKKGSLSHESLDVLKDLVETEKNLVKIEKYEEEKKEKEEMKQMGGSMGMGMDGGYSQRKFYIDADYMPYGQAAYAGGSYMDGNSYARGGNSRAGGQGGSSRMGGSYAMYESGDSYANGGGSYNMYYDPRYEQPPMYSMARGSSNYARGYSRNDKQSVVTELQELMNQTQDAKVKEAIQKTITEMNK